MNTLDTICAPATATGGAVSIIRLAGPDALACGNRAWRGASPLTPADARRMRLGTIGGDPALAVYMPGPHSYTGDDVVELHCHGGSRAAAATLRAALAAGCRMAEPGEFTFRAFVNGKLDLVQAEAVGDLVAAQSDMALQLAERQLAGQLSSEFSAIRAALAEVLAECESHLDFPDESLDWDPALGDRLAAPAARLAVLAESRRAGQLLREGVRVVLAGRPNAGKSSLLNRLLGYDRAIVTEIAGTTRDTLEESSVLHGIPVRLTDTAGLREGGDEIERIGIARSRDSLRTAEAVFWILDASRPDPAAECAELLTARPSRTIAVWNKIDLISPSRPLPALPYPTVRLSALRGDGCDELADAFAALIGRDGDWREPEIAINARHAELIREAAAALPEAIRLVGEAQWELAALPLHSAIEAIGKITGETVDPDVLEHIFSRFCIGK